MGLGFAAVVVITAAMLRVTALAALLAVGAFGRDVSTSLCGRNSRIGRTGPALVVDNAARLHGCNSRVGHWMVLHIALLALC